MALMETIAAGLLGGIGANRTNQANLDAVRLGNQAEAERQEKGLNALTGSTNNYTTTRNAAGGFDTKFNPGSGSDLLNRGDETRAGQSNTVTDAGLNFNLPNLTAARGAVEKDNNLQQGRFDRLGSDVIENKRRDFGGIGNTGENPATLRALGEFANQNRAGGEIKALDLLNKSQQAETKTRQDLLKLFAAQAPQLTLPGGAASNIITQTGQQQFAPDQSGAILPQALGGMLQTQKSDAAEAQKQDNFMKYLQAYVAAQPKKPQTVANANQLNNQQPSMATSPIRKVPQYNPSNRVGPGLFVT